MSVRGQLRIGARRHVAVERGIVGDGSTAEDGAVVGAHVATEVEVVMPEIAGIAADPQVERDRAAPVAQPLHRGTPPGTHPARTEKVLVRPGKVGIAYHDVRGDSLAARENNG